MRHPAILRGRLPPRVLGYPDSESGFRNDPAPCATENHVIRELLKIVFDRGKAVCEN